MSVRFGAALADLRRAAGWHRRVLAALLAAAAVGLSLHALAPPSPARVTVLAAGRDLPGGAVLTGADVATVRLPPAAVPAGALRTAAAVTGRTLAAPVRRGEPLTDVRLVGRGLAAALGADGLVAAPVRIADADAVGLLRVGDVVDVYGAGGDDPPGAPARLVTGHARVLVLPAAGDDRASDGALVVLAVDRADAAALAASANGRLSVVIGAG